MDKVAHRTTVELVSRELGVVSWEINQLHMMFRISGVKLYGSGVRLSGC